MMETDKIKKIWRDLLIAIGENPDRDGLKDTPERIVKMYQEIFKGYNEENKPKIKTFKNESDDISYSGMICDKGYFFSHCEHHGAPFFGEYYFGYVPDGEIIGLSKVTRIVEFFSSKLQVQERLTTEIVNYIESVLKPKGIILILRARHLCKEMRGVKMNGHMTTEISKGVFKNNTNGIRDEFISVLNGFEDGKALQK